MSKSKRVVATLKTGRYEAHIDEETKYLNAVGKFICSPFIMALLILAAIGMIFYFELSDIWWLWLIVFVSILPAAIKTTFKLATKNKLYISRLKARRCNNLCEAIKSAPPSYQQKIKEGAEMLLDDNASIKVYRNLAQTFIKKDFYTILSEYAHLYSREIYKRVQVIEFHVAMLEIGLGYVYVETESDAPEVANMITEDLISRVLHDSGFYEWEIERVDNGSGLVLFVLFDTNYSDAFDFGKEVDKGSTSMYEQLVETTQGAYYKIPLAWGIVWSIRDASHALVSGVTGYGKSFFINYLVMVLSIKRSVLYLADPKRSDLASFSHYMPSDRVASEPQAILDMVSKVVSIMNARYAYMEKQRIKHGLFQADFVDFGLPIVMLVIDEMAAFVSSLDKKSREEFETNIKAITLQGRQSGVNICSITQSPNTGNISSESRSQMGLRVYLGNSGGIEYRMLFGEGYEYAKRRYKPGEGLYMLSGETLKPELIQTPRLNKSQLPDALRQSLAYQYEANPLPERLCSRSKAEAEQSGSGSVNTEGVGRAIDETE